MDDPKRSDETSSRRDPKAGKVRRKNEDDRDLAQAEGGSIEVPPSWMMLATTINRRVGDSALDRHEAHRCRWRSWEGTSSIDPVIEQSNRATRVSQTAV